MRKSLCWISTALAVTLFVIGSVVIPTFAQEAIRLHFDISKNGSQVASPMMTVQDKGTGSFQLSDLPQISFTASRLDGDTVGVAFDFVMDGKAMKPSLKISRQAPGSISLKSSNSDSYEIKFAVVP